MNTRRFYCTVFALSLASSAAVMAADASGVQPQPASLQEQSTVRAMFTFADLNNDGQLTRAEAKGRLPITFSNFENIDTTQRGWISVEQFAAFTAKRGAAQADQVFKVGAGH